MLSLRKSQTTKRNRYQVADDLVEHLKEIGYGAASLDTLLGLQVTISLNKQPLVKVSVDTGMVLEANITCEPLIENEQSQIAIQAVNQFVKDSLLNRPIR